MSVTTIADERREDVRDSLPKIDLQLIKNIEQSLEDMIDPEIWGGKDWSR